MQLAREVHTLVHTDQSGFIPCRSIFDPIRLVKLMIEYADIVEENEVLIALDQEKAYDRIKHDYLIKTLETFQLPQTFIKTIKALYKNAYTKIAINGVLSAPFQVTRGVRQGDPLSCLLFDLAIEPLACALRNSDKLKGYNIPGITDKIIVNLYADDTTIFLSELDKYSDLETILSKWCCASGAKFNLEKTEIIPIGTKTHQNRVIQTRRTNQLEPPLNENIRIAPDGHPVRSLGAWISNKANNITPWEPVINKINSTLKRWKNGHPTLDRKKLIIQMVVGGMTQFLTKAQGMPKSIETALTKIIRGFIWDDAQTPPINLEQLQYTKTEGGIGLLDIKSRNEAIEITWIKAYLDLSPSRPAWASIMDLITNNIRPTHGEDERTNPFLTSWTPPSRGPKIASLPQEAQMLLKIAKKYNVSFAPIKLSKELKKNLPAWCHPGTSKNTYHKSKDKCLTEQHDSKSIKHLLKIRKRLTRISTNNQHFPRSSCPCTDCQKDRNKGCKNPHTCAQHANEILFKIAPKFDTKTKPKKDGLSLTRHRKEKNHQAHKNKQGEILFDPTVTNRSCLSDCFRIFIDPKKTSLTHLSGTIYITN